MNSDSLMHSVPTEVTQPTEPTQNATWSLLNLFQLAVGVFGIQFAWNTQIALSQQVLEPLGTSPWLYGLVWSLGSLLGLLLQPMRMTRSSTPVQTDYWGKRKGFILSYSLVTAIGMVYFPQAPSLLMAGIALALLDVTLNTAQGYYRSIVPDTVPPHQQPIAQSFMNFAFVLAPVVALGIFPLLQAFSITIPLTQQYLIAGITLLTFVFLGLQVRSTKNNVAQPPLNQPNSIPLAKPLGGVLSRFLSFSKDNTTVKKLCIVQFFVWTGVMCLLIYLTPFVVHHIYELPDMYQSSYKKEESLYQLAQKIDAAVVTEAHYKALSTVVTAVSQQKQQLIAPTIAEIMALNTQLDKALTPYFLGTTSQAFGVIKQLATHKELSSGISETERIIELKLALLEFPLYEKTLDVQTDSPTVETDPALGAFTTLPLLETLDKQEFYADTNTEARSTALLSLAIFNLVALLLTIPLSLLTKKWGKKRVFTLALTCMAISFGVAPWVHTPEGVFSMMAGAGIAWAAILSLPLALLKKHVLNENDLAVSGLLNRFMGIPQLVAALTVGYWVEQSPLKTAFGMSHNWSLAFIVASAMVILGIVVLQTVQENKA